MTDAGADPGPEKLVTMTEEAFAVLLAETGSLIAEVARLRAELRAALIVLGKEVHGVSPQGLVGWAAQLVLARTDAQWEEIGRWAVLRRESFDGAVRPDDPGPVERGS